jgi:hypothetical protein
MLSSKLFFFAASGWSREATREHLELKLSQRPPMRELFERNILQSVSSEDRLTARAHIEATLARRLSLRPTPEELEGRNILKSEPFVVCLHAYGTIFA